MKKTLYYLSPFIVVSFLAVSMELMDNIGIIKMSYIPLLIAFVVISAMIGGLSPSKNNFDYIMTARMPLSIFFTMFVAGFLDKDDLETRFNLDRAVDAAFQPFALILYLIIAIIVFLASFKKIRIPKFIRR